MGALLHGFVSTQSARLPVADSSLGLPHCYTHNLFSPALANRLQGACLLNQISERGVGVN